MTALAVAMLAIGCSNPSSGSDDSPGSPPAKTPDAGAPGSGPTGGTPAKSSDASLSGVLISSGILTPRFSPSKQDYTITVNDATESITITGKAANARAAVGDPSGKAQAIAMGDNRLSIGVTSEDGTATKAYSFTVVRKVDKDAPVITDFVIDQESIDSTLADQNVTGSITVEDCTGIGYVGTMKFIGPHGEARVWTPVPRSGNTATKAVYDWVLTVPGGTGAFTWKFDMIMSTNDTLGNTGSRQVQDPSIRVTFEDRSSIPADTTMPELVAATMSPTSLSVSTTKDQVVTITVTIRDDKALADIGLPYVSIHPLPDTAIVRNKVSPSGSTEQTWDIIVTVPMDNGAGSSKGEYYLTTLNINDLAGNEATYRNFNGFCPNSFTVK
jgi:hypothetical protein